MVEHKKEAKEIHFSGGKSYYLHVKSEIFPFVVDKHTLKDLDYANETLQKFVRLIEKKFDSIWYIGTDFMGEELFERFMFHHGGFMEISLKGELRCYFVEDKTEKMKEAIYYAVSKLTHLGSAAHLIKEIKTGQRLISLRDSVIRG